MMIEIEVLIKIVTVCAILFSVGFTLFKGWRNHDRKLINHETRIDNQDERLETMEKGFEDKFKELNGRINEVAKHNREDHGKLFNTVGDVKSMVSGIDGYIKGINKQSKHD